jgi:ketosteroid isomerase-like protein
VTLVRVPGALPFIALSGGEGIGGILSGEMPDVVVTRVQYSGPLRRSRNFEERLIVRFPALYRRLAALFERLSPHSRLRRALLSRGFVSGWAAFARRDFELILVRFAPDAELEFAPGVQTLGLSGTFRGHEAMTKGLRELRDGFASADPEPAYVVDLGDRVLSLGVTRAGGRGSDVQFEQKIAELVTAREGLSVRAQHFFSWEEGLRAAGLEPDAISLPGRAKTGSAASSATA